MVETIELDMAKEIIEAAEQKAEEIGVPSVITVANAEGNLIAQHRMDDAWLASVSISRNKAYTAAALQMPTHELEEVTKPEGPLYGLQTTDHEQIVIFGGGFPLEEDGEIIATIGSSGGDVDEDMEVARAGIDKFEELMN